MSIRQVWDRLRDELNRKEGSVEIIEPTLQELGIRSVTGKRTNGVWELTIAFDNCLVYSTSAGTFEHCVEMAVKRIQEVRDDA